MSKALLKCDCKATHKPISATLMYRERVPYSITLNPAEQHFQLVRDRLKHLKADMWETCNKLRYSEIRIYPELSNTSGTTCSRWHYHGWIKILDSLNFHLYDLPLLDNHCNVDIDTIECETLWYQYVMKNRDIMKGHQILVPGAMKSSKA